MNSTEQSFRSKLVTRRTYNRPREDGSFETWDDTVDRVIDHQRWLWERAQGHQLQRHQYDELDELRELMRDRKISVSGRTLWLGGTETAKRREASQFNCAFTRIETVFDVVDGFWLLLQGCGVGFQPVVGTLNGFAQHTTVEVVRSERTDTGGVAHNVALLGSGPYDQPVWTLRIGDSAEAWAKAVGKLLAYKGPATKILIDLSEVRPAGGRLNGYGWLCSGDGPLAEALESICRILNQRAGQLLTAIDILDILNLLGTTLSSRRSAEIAVLPTDDAEAEDFALAKKDHFENAPWRASRTTH